VNRKEQFEKSFRFVIARDSDIIVGAGRMISDGECHYGASLLMEMKNFLIG